MAKAKVSQNPARDLAQIDVATTALVDSPLSLPPGPAGEARLLSDTPGKIRVAAEAPARQLLVVSERYHAGWRCLVDNVATPTRRVNGDFFGCVLPAGRHEVAFTFQPMSLRIGKELSALGLGLLAVCCFVQLIVPSRVRSNPPR